MRCPHWIFALVVIVFLNACAATHVAYVHDTCLGVDLSFSAEGHGRFAVGYDREVFALVPKRTADADSNDAMSLTSLSDVALTGLDEIKFNHLVATGTPAVALVKDPDGLKRIREAFYGETAPKDQEPDGEMEDEP
jgi:hypothetical protein